ncbi:MAG: helix-turn-helix domain-containing protein [Ruminiclostridium sp.]
MASRLTDIQKKKIIADYLETQSYRATARLNNVCANTVKNVVDNCDDFAQKLSQKKEENTSDILAYMDSKRQTVCEIIDKGLSALNDTEKLKAASPAQITTALGTLIDKWSMKGGSIGANTTDDGLSKSLRELAEGLESDE